jgi:type VI secretion system protein ImpF
MADPTPKELLQPALLDRLSDDDPERKTESREDRVLTLRRLRQCVVRDLEWLFNCGAIAADPAAPLDPLVAASVVNYGVPSFAGVQASNTSLPRLEQALRDAIWNFEPRLLHESVRVRARRSERMNRHALTFEVQAQLWAHPLPIELYLRTELDLESGHIAVLADQESRG